MSTQRLIIFTSFRLIIVFNLKTPTNAAVNPNICDAELVQPDLVEKLLVVAGTSCPERVGTIWPTYRWHNP